MRKSAPTLSKVMLILGGILVLSGLGWGIWSRVDVPPDPTFTDEGAVVLAETAAPAERPTQASPVVPISTPTSTPTPTLTPLPTLPAKDRGPTPDLLPQWTVTQPPEEPTATIEPSTPQPPPPTLTSTPTPLPKAEEPPTRIVAPAIDLDADIVPMGWEMVDYSGTLVSEWIVPTGAAGWHINSALPGNTENVVLSGHHNVKGKVFRHVIDLSMGDEITMYVGETPYTYTVSEKYILKESGMSLDVRKKNAQWIMPTGDERLTLVTCWPYEWPGNTHRVIVVARPPGQNEARRGAIQ